VYVPHWVEQRVVVKHTKKRDSCLRAGRGSTQASFDVQSLLLDPVLIHDHSWYPLVDIPHEIRDEGSKPPRDHVDILEKGGLGHKLNFFD